MDEVPWFPNASSTYDSASWISKLFFDWTRKLAWKIWKNPISGEETTKEVPSVLKSNKIYDHYQTLSTNNGKYIFFAVLKKRVGKWLGILLLSLVKYSVLLLIQAYYLGKMIASYSESSDLLHERYIPAAVLLSIAIPTAFIKPQFNFFSELEGARLRILSYSLIYNKLLRIRLGEMYQINIGQLINMFASDADKLEEFLRVFLMRVSDVILIPVLMAFLYLICGLPGINGVLVLILLGLSGPIVANQFKKIALKKAVLVDQRLKLTTDMISEAKTMKMFCWENAYYKSIEEIKKKEMRICLQINYYKAIGFVLKFLAIQLAMIATIVTALYFNQEISARVIYTSFAIYNAIAYIFSMSYQNLVHLSADAFVSFQRLKKILSIKDIDEVMYNPSVPISLVNITSSWQPLLNGQDDTKFSLSSINIMFPCSGISAITGAVGSGKSMLLLTIANEIFIHFGKVKRGGSMTYLPQEPWLFPSTVKQNILFGLPFDEHRYNEITYSCALLQDFSQLPDGDRTVIDEKGLTLSGGQKARIALARAMYRQSDVYLLDDPLSAVDVNVAKHIWTHCLKVCGKTVLLVTHAFHVISQCDTVIQLEKGCVVDRDVEQLKLDLKEDNRGNTIDEAMETKEVRKMANSGKIRTKTPEIKNSGKKRNNVLLWCRMAWTFANGYGMLFIILSLSILPQIFKTLFDILFSKWIYAERRAVTNALVHYKPWSLSLNTLWIFIGVGVLLSIVKLIFFIYISIYAARRFHQHMLKSITRAKLSFFESHQTGQIMNRFSKDIQFVDDLLIYYLEVTSRSGLTLLGFFINVCYGSTIASAPMVLVIFAIVLVLWNYLKVVNPLKRMEASARSPMFSCLTCTLTGIAIVRSHQNQSIMSKEFNNKQDRHSAVRFLLRGLNYWLGLMCEFIGLLQLYIVIICALLFPNLTNFSRLGVGLSSAIAFGSELLYNAREMIAGDNMSVSIERIQEYIDLPAEEGYEGAMQQVPSNWPEFGRIMFQNVNVFYGDFQALKNISFDILPNEKIGIVGRTGAGKSSLISALFRLTDTDGEIEIDGVNIKTLSLIEYRKKISLIPQNPVILSGSIRHNLDTLDEFSDEQLWDALECVHLKDEVMRKEKKLEDGMKEFSCGQKQLFCLARTLLHKNKILILDEATSNVDNDTDIVIQQLIKTTFCNSTILVIAHRLQTVMDLDRIMVIENGEILEFDSPTALLSTVDSVFKQLTENVIN